MIWLMARRPSVMRGINTEDLPWEELVMSFAEKCSTIYLKIPMGDFISDIWKLIALWPPVVMSKEGMRSIKLSI